jgi:hypothetical protein
MYLDWLLLDLLLHKKFQFYAHQPSTQELFYWLLQLSILKPVA